MPPQGGDFCGGGTKLKAHVMCTSQGSGTRQREPQMPRPEACDFKEQ